MTDSGHSEEQAEVIFISLADNECMNRVSTDRSAYLKAHIAVILFGFTAILGGLIDLPALSIVWWRVLVTSASLVFLTGFLRTVRSLDRKTILIYAGIGMLIGLHWICFYGSVKLSNASICLVCMSTTSLFTSLLEPVIVRTRFSKVDLMFGGIIVPAFYFIVNTLDTSYTAGIIVGLLSALLAAVFSILNKMYIKGADPFTISFIELSSAWVMITVLLIPVTLMSTTGLELMPPAWDDWVYLFVLALLCTTLAHVLSLQALRTISVFNSNLIINLEPVYGIILAGLLLSEHKQLDLRFYTGTAIILGAVILYPIVKPRLETKL